MVETKFLVEIVIVIVCLAVALFWVYTNYQATSGEFFDFLSDIPLFSGGGPAK